MEAVLRALARAAGSLVHPVILLILLVPMVVAVAAWLGLAWVYWDTWSSAIQSLVVDHTAYSWTARWDLTEAAGVLAVAVLVILLMPAIIITALLIAAANVSGLLMARATARHQEMAVRIAIGATRGRILTQLLTESVVLAIAGGTAGVLLAMWMVAGLVRFSPADLTVAGDVTVDTTVLLLGSRRRR